MSQNVYQTLEEVKLLPLYTATDLSYIPKVEEILVENHVPLIEVTFRSKLAGEAIKQLSASGKLLVGAGTVRTLKEVKIAIENGATFIVSPSVVPEVIEYCLEQEIPIFPGTATPTDIQQAASYGIKTVKFFPADIYGGLKAINALSGPFYDIKFLPTGGINEENFLEYIENPNVVGIGGSFILSEKVIMEDNGVKMNQILQSLVEKINKL
ncbi:bifunctional 4-hydroxy-2-oxoglutarate aldolase/2-dehydro-3-deoxy-phosphogluconate aldolase [Enterococcus viikkiensis]|uniref:bifunctional 4-hydroxy-2-oxoglutarate aldolase/2-dehydro-3-deoxy-phosphogluconate aldolase n=1 Tax=Enterococcus viikkiensis TaxID=930854 RepID=UPI0010F66829|nr:bifunctional 4-hydroxy-2-oxoglutarate aldolase/2-dehydro-3-deoxy-phosphogluconate aldolase [Enterococcus viikkiensis]